MWLIKRAGKCTVAHRSMGATNSTKSVVRFRRTRSATISCCFCLMALVGCGGETETVSFAEGVAGATSGRLSTASAGSGMNSDGAPVAMLSSQLHECTEGEPDDPILANRLVWQDNTLVVEGSHSGGCEEHQYGLCYEAEQQAIVLNLTLTLLHESGGDHCEAYFGTGELVFELAPLFEQYQEFFEQPQWEVAAKLQKYKLLRLSETVEE